MTIQSVGEGAPEATLLKAPLSSDSLRRTVMRGGALLAFRHAIGTALAFVGVAVTARIIGAEQYGYFAGAIALFTYVQNVCLWGVDVYLIRGKGDIEADDFHQAFSLLLVISLIGGAIAAALMPLYSDWTPEAATVTPLAIAMFVGLPVTLLSFVPIAYMERRLDYRGVAIAGLAGQLPYPILSVTLAWQGFGVAAPLIGWWATAITTLVVSLRLAGYKPRWAWQWDRIKPMLTSGLGYGSSMWIWQLRNLANALVVGKLLGPAAMAHVGLSLVLVDRLSFVKAATWRVSLSAMARVQTDRPRLLSAIRDGMRLQVLSLGVVFALSGLMAPVVFPWLFGAEFAPMLQLFPLIAAAMLMNALFSMQSSALYVLKRNWDVAAFHLVHVAILFIATFLLVPRMGVIGYGWAEIAATVSYAVIHAFTSNRIGPPDYRVAAIWLFAFAIVPFWPQIHWWAFVGLLPMLASADSWRAIGDYTRTVRRAASH